MLNMNSIRRSEKVEVEDLKKAITEVDPEIDQAQMDAYLCWAFQVKEPLDLTMVSNIDLGDLIVRLQNGNLSRIGKKV